MRIRMGGMPWQAKRPEWEGAITPPFGDMTPPTCRARRYSPGRFRLNFSRTTV